MIELLGSKSHKERDAATKQLVKAGYLAYLPLKRVPLHDLEVKTRVEGTLKQIKDNEPPDLLKLEDEDVIHAAAFPIVGRLIEENIEIRSPLIGTISLKIFDIRKLYVRTASGERELTVDAAKHGSNVDQWLDTGLVVELRQSVTIKSAGQVDLWPQGPGQYMATPKGYTTAGKGGNFMAGALIGKIGKEGKSFLIGEQYEGVSAAEGTLYLHIVPSPWNNASVGTFSVRIRTQYALSLR